MKDQFKPSVKELYSSLHAPESLRQRTLAAVEAGKPEKKAKILELSFKTLGAVAACFLLCFGLLLSGIFEGGDLNIALDGNNMSAEAVTYLPQAVPLSAKSADNSQTGDALKLDVEADEKTTVGVDGAALLLENELGQLCEVAGDAEIKGKVAIYLLTGGADEIKVTFTSKHEEKTLTITANSDGTYSVGIK